MTISNTVQGAVALNDDQSGLWVRDQEPFANIISKDKFGFITLFGQDDLAVEQVFGDVKLKTVKPLITSQASKSMKPEIETYLTLPTTFTQNGTTTAGTAGSTSNYTLVSTAGLKKYDLLLNQVTGAVIQVDSITSSTVIAAYPHAAGVTGDGSDAAAAGQKWNLTGSAYPDGATFGEGFNITPSNAYNYMQFMVDEYGEGMIRKELALYPKGDSTLDIIKMDTRINHNRKRELAYLFGERAANTDTNANITIYSMHGLTGFSSAQIDAGGSLTWDEWTLGIHTAVAANGGGNYHSMVGNTPLAVLSGLAQAMIKTTPEDKVYGNKVERIRAPLGDVVLHGTEPMDEREGEMLMFKPELLKRRFLTNLNSIHLETVQAQNVAKHVSAFATAETLIPRNVDHITTVINVNA